MRLIKMSFFISFLKHANLNHQFLVSLQLPNENTMNSKSEFEFNTTHHIEMRMLLAVYICSSDQGVIRKQRHANIDSWTNWFRFIVGWAASSNDKLRQPMLEHMMKRRDNWHLIPSSFFLVSNSETTHSIAHDDAWWWWWDFQKHFIYYS